MRDIEISWIKPSKAPIAAVATDPRVVLLAAGLIRFEATLTVLLGANLGTTATAWLVSFKLNGIGPWLIVLGAALNLFLAAYETVAEAQPRRPMA